MLIDNIKKLFEGWENDWSQKDSPFAKLRLAKEPLVDQINDMVEAAGPEGEDTIFNLIYDFLQVSPSHKEDPWESIQVVLRNMRIDNLKNLLTHLQQSTATPNQPAKTEGTGPSDGNSGDNLSMAGSMTYESKEIDDLWGKFDKEFKVKKDKKTGRVLPPKQKRK